MLNQERHAFKSGDLTLSYLDSIKGQPLLALHAHWMEGATFLQLATDLSPDWRVIALDQRGHGYSDHSTVYTRAAYLSDIVALLDHLGLDKVAVLGNSLGGVNAYQFAARYSERVLALIVEDIGAIIDDDTSFALAWQGIYPTRDALVEKIGERLSPALATSIRETALGWKLTFNPEDMVASQKQLNGDHWDDWVASRCPALLIRGRESRVSDAALFQQMAARRPRTQLVTLDGGHVVHFDNPRGFSDAVRDFLSTISQTTADNTLSTM